MKKILITDLKLDIKNTNKVRNYFESKNGMLYSSIIKLLNFTNLLIILKVNYLLYVNANILVISLEYLTNWFHLSEMFVAPIDFQFVFLL